MVVPVPIPGSLSKPAQDIVCKVLKTIRATKYKDPVDQEAFLLESANAVLPFRSQLASFVLVPDLGECVFTLRSMMHASNAHLGTALNEAFTSIQEFVGEIVRHRHVIRDRRLAHADHIRAAEGVATRIECSAALEHAASIEKAAPRSPDEDCVSIPSSGDESSSDALPAAPKNSLLSPVSVDSTGPPPSSRVRTALLLSPLNELEVRLGRMSLDTFPFIPLRSPLSSSPSLPDLVPDYVLNQHWLPVKGDGLKRGRTTTRKLVRSSSHLPACQADSLQRNSRTRVPVVQCHTLQMVPRPFGPPPLSPRNNFVDDWLLSRPKFTVSPQKELLWQLHSVVQPQSPQPAILPQAD
ncbi:hypothetical protein DFH09DRAFT_1324546 [Mycena vulgaris]|nr:hypothetical protein DFH09DRAFT_1324546 [Mycena vulgaris]